MNFVIIGNSWDAGRDNPTSKHQIALKLGEKGHRVLWVDGAGMRRPSLGSGGDRAKMASKLKRGIRPAYQVAENIWRISPLILPLPGVGAVRWMNERIYLVAICKAVRRIGLVNPVLINFLPTVPGILAKWSIENRELRDCENAGLREDHRPERDGENIDHRLGDGERGKDEGGKTEDYRQNTQGPKHPRTQIPKDPSIQIATEQLNNLTTGHKVATIYYCVDRWDQFGAYDSGLMERLDAECCRNADAVIASAQDLYERCRRHNENTVLLPHGVDWGHFARGLGMGKTADCRPQTIDHRQNTQIPKDSSAQIATEQPDNLATADAAPRRRIGFFGLISEWVDQDLLIALAEKIEDCELVLAGKADVNTDRLAEMRNVKMIGSVPYAELPALVGSFDAGIIPFKVNELTRAVNPIKLREMLAAGCPVVSTALPEVEKLAREMPEGAVMVAGSQDEFVECVRRILDAPPTPEDRKRISDSVKDQDWSAKVEETLELLNRSMPQPR